MKPEDPCEAAKQVLREAAQTERFFDLTEAGRLIWMLERAFSSGSKRETRLWQEQMLRSRRGNLSGQALARGERGRG
jgi:hypothetical protein